MTYTVTDIRAYDSKRMKVTLDQGEVTFLLYRGELESLGLGEGSLIDGSLYAHIADDILLPRAKRKVLYYLKDSDRTRYEIASRLRAGFYPGDVIEKVMEFLDRYALADDIRCAGSCIEALRRSRSRREIEARLHARGLAGDEISDLLGTLTDEDEYAACTAALRKRYPGGLPDQAMPKAYAFLARKGYGSSIITRALRSSAGNHGHSQHESPG